ncbi:exodeoxyribonuclease III [Candidatus Endobugula sertula]|uniref:Exodeoxyribonuclease III n=1 Tax=Candidatus Endobugula sertula TaxID=62101 RepID=A0A1D2QRH6_9GAMM|nr:exodeoxyribonuclease III [Candidatus Endobugula sertula]
MRIISLSVDGIHQAAQRGLYNWLSGQDADVICLQDLRCLEYEMDDDIFHPKGYNAYFLDSGTQHYNGVAIYTRQLPKALIYDLGFPNNIDMRGRYLQIDFSDLSIGSFLAPSALNDIALQEAKAQFFDGLQAYLAKLSGKKRRDFIFCGNWAMAAQKADVSNPETQINQSGFLPEEQQWMAQLLQVGYIDAFRQSNKDKDEYSWWPSGTPDKGEAWRIDTHIVSSSLKKCVEYAIIYKNQLFSSHLPVIVDYDIEIESGY